MLELERGIILFVVPVSLLFETISMIIYGTFKIRLKAWQVFLSSFYVFAFAVFAILMPRIQASPYSSIAGALGEFFGSLFGSLFIAGIIASILTFVYRGLRNPKKKR